MTSTRGNRRWAAPAVVAILMMLAAAIASPAQTFSVLHSFDSIDGAYPVAGLSQATDGNLYGTTYLGGANGYGVVFKVTPTGSLAVVYNFCSQPDCSDGESSYAPPVQATDGNFYGTTVNGGAADDGTVFKMTPAGILTTIHNFCSQSSCADGVNPVSALLQGADGSFYGTTVYGGDFDNGTVFKITPGGKFVTLYSFCSQTNCADGSQPLAALFQATDGNFYGTTYTGGMSSRANCPVGSGCGTVFKITPGGVLTTLYSFCSQSQSGCPDGASPYRTALVQGANGNFYGTTTFGGDSAVCDYGCGTIFEITPNGALTTLHSFDNTDGSGPNAGLVQATDENLYGTSAGGAHGAGTIFRITPSGTLTTLHSFCAQKGCRDGNGPFAPLVQDTDGSFYGTTFYGGASAVGGALGYGTVFSVSTGLSPFVETVPTSGKVGSAIKILGTNLKGATSVSFSGTAAVFKVISGSLITTTVPAGATSGKVQVVTPSGTLSSNVPFRVAP